MAEVWFYHLERTSLDQALPELLEKTLAKGWKAVVRSGSRDRLEHLDGWLWSWRDDSFLPHGVAGEPQAERQPVLLTTGEANDNGAQALFLQRFVDGKPWAHLDIASTAWKKPSSVPTIPEGASGYGVRLLNRLVKDRYEDA